MKKIIKAIRLFSVILLVLVIAIGYKLVGFKEKDHNTKAPDLDSLFGAETAHADTPSPPSPPPSGDGDAGDGDAGDDDS